MKTLIGVVGLSILAAIVGVFAATELHDMASESADSRAVSGTYAGGAAQPSQRIQQWVNH